MNDSQLTKIIDWYKKDTYVHDVRFQDPYLNHVATFWAENGRLTPVAKTYLLRVEGHCRRLNNAESRKIGRKVYQLLHAGSQELLPDVMNEKWARVVVEDIVALPAAQQTAWRRLFFHAEDCESGKPSPEWAMKAVSLVADLENFVPLVTRWLSSFTVPEQVAAERYAEIYGEGGYVPPMPTGRFTPVSDRNQSILKGLAWACSGESDVALARAFERLAGVGLQKLPGVGEWAIRPALAAIGTLGEMPNCAEAVSALARLKSKITYKPAVKQIEATLESEATRQGVTKDDLEDLSVVTYGLQDSVRRETFDTGYAAEMRVSPTGDVTLSYFAPDGKRLKSAPAALKSEANAEQFKALKADADAAAKTLTAQKARFDTFYLQQRTWKYADFVARFIEHPLLRQIAGRLMWHFARLDGTKAEGIHDAATGGFADVNGEPIADLAPDTTVSLWHPLGFAPEYVVAWRERLSALGVVQPFKQAHREVYLLTDAELRTRTYSNRFAGHIVKQHQMNALAAIRSWRNPLRLMVDDSYPPASRDLLLWNIRAEYWVEGAGDNYETDITESGSYLYLSTDQVRFYRLDAPTNYAHASGGGYSVVGEPMPLSDVPALVFSEILRDVDLFVGVASVGNDPTWADTGATGAATRYADYWHGYAFGDLSESAETRKDILAKLLPRTKIADRCVLDGRFIKVRGDIRTYKIHLGSGNILMEPNDQYLCIVPGGRGMAMDGIALPFEGDTRLSVILSKAFLLADDTKITDTTILRQIR